MIVVSLLTQRTVPANVGQVMLRMHLPEALSRQTYRTISHASLLAQDRPRGDGGSIRRMP
jgi:hypothetical protein